MSGNKKMNSAKIKVIELILEIKVSNFQDYLKFEHNNKTYYVEDEKEMVEKIQKLKPLTYSERAILLGKATEREGALFIEYEDFEMSIGNFARVMSSKKK